MFKRRNEQKIQEGSNGGTATRQNFSISWDLDSLEFGFGPTIPTFLQTEAAECGLACLAMVAHYHGSHVDLVDLRREYPISLKGMRLTQLIEIASEIGISTRAVRLELTALSKLELPCILHWNLDHFVVLKSVSKSRLTIVDPAVGIRHMSLAEASECFTGIALELWPNPKFRRETKNSLNQISLSGLIGKTKGLIPLFVQIVALALGIELLSLLAPLMTQWVIDYVIVSHDYDLLVTCGVGFGIVMLVQNTLTAMRGWVLMYLGTTLGIQWQANIFAHLMRLPIEYFQKRHLGDLVSRFGSIVQIQNTITGSFMAAILDGIMSIATLTLMVIYSVNLSLVAFVAVFLYVILRATTFAPLRDITQEAIVRSAKQQTHFLETLRGIRAVKLFGREELRRLNWLSLLVQQTNAALKSQRAMLIFQTANGLLFGVERIAVLWWGAEMVMHGNFTVGVLMAFLAYKEQFDARIASLTDQYFEFRMLRVHTARISDIVMTAPERDSNRVSVTQKLDLDPLIEVCGVKYRYAPHEPFVLRGITFSVMPGETVAIVGRSGCGKSTLVNVLLGILRPTEGIVKVGGIDVQHLGARALRELIGSVSQDDTLFAGSIAQNITFFDDRPDLNRVEECARLAAVHEDITLMPMGYRTLVGDMGTALSGGQKQRVLIARALYRNPKIFVLDEATSDLDLQCEALVMKAIKAQNASRIIVSHRPETVAAADRVISITNGATEWALESLKNGVSEDWSVRQESVGEGT